MRADIGGGGPAIAHLHSRRARAQLLSGSGRGAVLALIAAIALLVGLGIYAGHSYSNPAALIPYALIGR